MSDPRHGFRICWSLIAVLFVTYLWLPAVAEALCTELERAGGSASARVVEAIMGPPVVVPERG